ncbi:amino acid adenylation domain-containing protein [Sinirhodobacter ferrireducens]|uniref:Amino acid adenylation domain-containing protein n=2 Tax=Paenirhodobacter ferrireducens TaxID=1215032 RepID=A0A443LVG1_9RHOB|nr:amino acid adenylation domain-containing protein [Sinirhodobacter ferrireducens]RWR53163.1 amino acid adenylation domain-containing protein [Sinirhodobacter ferrireducens]
MSDPARLHLIGVGGSGMLPLALLLKQAGHPVTGSDTLCAPARLAILEAQGIAVLSGADPALARAADCVVASPAIPETHVERRAARRDGIPVKTRARMLAELISGRRSICVAGSHGKSTVTAMLVEILHAAGPDDFGYMLGASFADPDIAPARLGAPGAPFVTEACEAHGALAQWQPTYAILTNLDDDHADHYGGLTGVRRAFADFLSRLPPEGRAVVCGDDPAVVDALGQARCAALTYGFGDGNALRAVPDGSQGTTVFLHGNALGTLSLAVPGRHNLLNAMAALGMAMTLGIDFQTTAGALAAFRGIARRLQRVSPEGRPRVFDDFAHHPTEIAAALAVLRETTQGRLIAVLEPQLHSRVTRMAARFAQALAAADRSFILPVAALGESVQAGDGDAALADACRAAGLSCQHVPDVSELLLRLQDDLRDDDTVVVMAGASGAALAPRLAETLSHPAARPPPPAPTPSVLIGESRPLPPDLLSLVAGHADRQPTAPAVEMGHRRLSYADLVLRTDDLASALAAAGVSAGDSVGVCLGRTVDRVSAFLAILRLGGIFVPLDPALPEERLRYMLETAGVRTVVVNAASPALPDIGLSFVNCGQLPDPDGRPAPRWHAADSAADALAYMIFTSGTTGQPKAVEIPRGALANYAVAASRHFQITPGARVSQISGFGFDVSVGDLAVTLAAGACLVYPTDLQAVPGPPVGRFIAQARLTHLSLTPSALAIIPPAEHPHLTHVIVAGEACSPALVERWGKGRSFINAYGPTEATVEALFAPCTPGSPVTIGRPFDNMGACLMDETLRLVAPGQEGELCLFGSGLARGYRHQPELTAQRFPVVDLPGRGPTRIYRTGDRAKAGADGAFICLGRMDSQLKVNGYRIEPGEVEAALCSLPGVSDAAVSLASSPHSSDRLIAHVVMMPDVPAPDPVDLRARLRQQLPSYMVPSVFLPVPEIPRNANGKRDRRALPVPPHLTRPPNAHTTGTATEAKLMALIDKEAGGSVVAGTRDSLRDAGIDSLTMANLLFAIEEAFGITLDTGLEAGFDTVEVLALMVDARLKAPNVPTAPDIGEALNAKILPHLATWPGQRLGKAGLVRSLSAERPLPKLFWCFQSGQELARLSECLDDAVSLFGMRSGHLAVEYTAETLAALGRLYADEITSIAPTGPLFLGGNCQGGLVMREAGLELMRQGRTVALTILMEQGRFFHYPGTTLLLFGAGSYLNPYGHIAAPEQLFRTAYPAGHDVEIIPGAHGHYFRPGNVEALAATVLRHIDRHHNGGGAL